MYLCTGREIAIDIVQLFLESLIEHLISFVQYKHLDRTSTKVAITLKIEMEII